MGTGYNSGLTGHDMKVNGGITKHVGKGSSCMWMGIVMRGSGRMIKQMAMECISILTGLSMKGNGKMIYSMDLESKHGQMEVSMRDIT